MSSKNKFIVDARGGIEWIGGLYYRRNVMRSLSLNRDFTDAFDMRVLASADSLSLFREIDGAKAVAIDGAIGKLNGYGGLMAGNSYLFPAHPGKLLTLARRVKPIYWIPDFQEEHYSEYFDEEEIKSRRASNRKVAESDGLLVLSSQACLDDFERFYPDHICRTCILHFVSYIEPELRALTPAFESEVLRKYGLTRGTYFIIANQFWQHKNHRIVLDAMEELSRRGVSTRFVFTGEPRDYRFPSYIDEIKAKMDPFIANGQLTVTGFIDRGEQLALLKNARAVVQPSLFEGWGTVLEDSKVLDKDVLLSDIPVHREQMTERCRLFDPMDADDLANGIEACLFTKSSSNVEVGIADAQRRAAEYSKGIVSELLNWGRE